ncbi:origin recognition complex subunit 4 [Gigaspora margarita]|uniref:Origin recognition complex subunit 4 n=1 Tax=Gigaspora margarita TaxID=4874 RepID=A0A8H3WWD5_GIGMA|nr:origin recognition complex subunit 4 [Gigaspora margarita]
MINEAIVDDIEYYQEFDEKIEELFDDASFYNLINQTFNYLTDFFRCLYKICFDVVGELIVDSPFLLPEDYQCHLCKTVDTLTLF